jgi:hypothetical protein
MIRDILLGVFALAWLVVVVITALHTGGMIPPELWAVLGVGAGSLVAVFRTDDYVAKRPKAKTPEDGS